MAIADTAALFTSTALAEREITLTDGSVVHWHFAKLPAAEWVQYQFAMATGADEGVRARASLRLVMLSLREPGGKPALTLEQVGKIDPAVVQQLIKAAVDVCRPAPDAGNS